MLLDIIKTKDQCDKEDNISFASSDSAEMEGLEDHISYEIIMKSDKLHLNHLYEINSSIYPSANSASSIMFREDSILKKDARDVDPIKLYTQLTGRTGDYQANGKEYALDEFIFYLNLSHKEDQELLINVPKLNRLPNINGLLISSIMQKDRNVKMFLNYVTPKRLQQFTFEG